MKNKSVYIGTPMYGGLCYHGYVNSLLENISDLSENNIESMWQFIGNESLITRGRNFIVDKFLKSSCSHLMFIDSDIVFPRDSIRKLLETNKDVVGAAYPKKTIDWEMIRHNAQHVNVDEVRMLGASYVINLDIEDDGSDELSIKKNKKGLIQVKHAGTGFLLISRKALEKLKPHMKQTRSASFGKHSSWYTEFFKTGIEEESDLFLSEDWMFCNDWRKIGGKVWMMPEIKLDHIGTHIYSGSPEKFGFNIT